MSTLRGLLKKGTEVLEKSGIQEAGLDAWLLLEYETGSSRAYYFAHQEEEVSGEQERDYFRLIEERAAHKPLQHITGRAYFMGYEFSVNRHVLIPRQDTEILAEEALRAAEGLKAPRILDMCTGSGCILISLLLKLPGSTGVGVDVSREALETAKKNAAALGAAERALFLQSDLFSSEEFREKGGNRRGQYDILVSNPPYIRTEEIDTLMEEVRLYDPRIALDGHEDGLYFYRRITGQAGSVLKKGGWLLYETGADQGRAVAEIMKNAGFSRIQIKKDLAGLDRVVLGKKEEEKCSIN